jgi:RND family efflux transporter MFP subunit
MNPPANPKLNMYIHGGRIMLKKIIPLIILLLLVAAPGCGRKKAAAVATQAIPVKVAPVQVGDIHEIYTTTGTLEANKESKVSAKISGRIARVDVKLGNYVTRNQTLIVLEQDDLINQNRQVQAALSQAEANYQQSKSNFNRIQKLYDQEVVSQQDYDQSKTALEIAQNQLQQAQANLALNENQMNYAYIKAPFNGFIGTLSVTLGEVVSPGVPLLSVADLSNVLVVINLSDSYIGRVTRGKKVNLTFTAYPGEVFQGTVSQIAPVADSATKTFPVKIFLANPGNKFKAGMLAEVKFNFNERKNVVKIPVDAVVDEVGNKSVFTVEKDTAARKSVSLGITDGTMVEVLSGLTGNEKIVVMGQNNLDDGLKVVVK